jgi:hypothetical protein
MSLSNPNMPNISPGHCGAVDPATRHKPFRTTAKAEAIQQRDTCFSLQGSS